MCEFYYVFEYGDRFCMALVAGLFPVAAFWADFFVQLVCTVAGTVSEVSSVTVLT